MTVPFPAPALQVGKIEFAPVVRLLAHRDTNLLHGWNTNVHAVRELQATVAELTRMVDELAARVAELEKTP